MTEIEKFQKRADDRHRDVLKYVQRGHAQVAFRVCCANCGESFYRKTEDFASPPISSRTWEEQFEVLKTAFGLALDRGEIRKRGLFYVCHKCGDMLDDLDKESK